LQFERKGSLQGIIRAGLGKGWGKVFLGMFAPTSKHWPKKRKEEREKSDQDDSLEQLLKQKDGGNKVRAHEPQPRTPSGTKARVQLKKTSLHSGEKGRGEGSKKQGRRESVKPL